MGSCCAKVGSIDIDIPPDVYADGTDSIGGPKSSGWGAADTGECNQSVVSRAPRDAFEDATDADDPPDKISNTQLVVNCDGTDLAINVVLSLTSTSTVARNTVTWTYAPAIPGVRIDGSKLVGKFTDPIEDFKRYNVTVTAKKSDGTVIDARDYVIIASKSKCTKGTGTKFICPVRRGVVTSKVKMRYLKEQPEKGVRAHKGIDLVSESGNLDILASGDGTVIFVKPFADAAGRYIVIEHLSPNGKVLCYTRYLHLASVSVATGAKVSAGQKIGTMGTGDGKYALHLHFEMLTPQTKGNNVPGDNFSLIIDPIPYIAGQDGYPKIRDSAATASTVAKLEDVIGSIKNGTCTFEPAPTRDPVSGAPGPTDAGYSNNMDSNEVSHGGCNAKPVPTPATNSTPAPNQPNQTVNKTPNGPYSPCCPDGYQFNKLQVENAVKTELNNFSSLTAEDKQFILKLISIESGFNPYAFNKSTGATGLFQFLPAHHDPQWKKGNAYKTHPNDYREPWCQQMCQIPSQVAYFVNRWFLPVIKGEFTAWKSGRKKVAPAHDAFLKSCSSDAVMYGIHHDGAGGVFKLSKTDGIEIFRRKFA